MGIRNEKIVWYYLFLSTRVIPPKKRRPTTSLIPEKTKLVMGRGGVSLV